MLGAHRDDAYAKRGGDIGGHRTDAIYLAVDDPDALYEKVKASGATIEMEPYNTDYGSRDFAARDPEGGLWSFGTYWPKVGEESLPG
ncbi:VOC family protein [Bradyrhizobium diazoefficiens]|nr:VOC family protein [Bradyrhizobium diazoefficiens]MBR0886579.1 VOC family protein [Bradyrhizobium diazoefficiens]MBR0918402.1 VOC family protein [Bradyrhizobium diazoefficiens]